MALTSRSKSSPEPADAPALPSTDAGTVALLAQIVSALADVRQNQSTLEAVVRKHTVQLAEVVESVAAYDQRLTDGINRVTVHSPHSESFAVGAVTRQAAEVSAIKQSLERALKK